MNSLTEGEIQHIVEESVINPFILSEIKNLVKSRKIWKIVANVTETVSNVLVVVSAILTFASGTYEGNGILAFIAGSISVTSLALMRFSDFSNNQSKNRNITLNELLDKINVQQMPMPIAVQNITSDHYPSTPI
jgi:hypothetical protein